MTILQKRQLFVVFSNCIVCIIAYKIQFVLWFLHNRALFSLLDKRNQDRPPEFVRFGCRNVAHSSHLCASHAQAPLALFRMFWYTYTHRACTGQAP